MKIPNSLVRAFEFSQRVHGQPPALRQAGLALASIQARCPLAATGRLEGVDGTKLIPLTRTLQEGTVTIYLPQQKTPFARPPAISVSVPEILPRQPHSISDLPSVQQIQMNLVTPATLTTTKARDGMLGLSFRQNLRLYPCLCRKRVKHPKRTASWRFQAHYWP